MKADSKALDGLHLRERKGLRITAPPTGLRSLKAGAALRPLPPSFEPPLTPRLPGGGLRPGAGR